MGQDKKRKSRILIIGAGAAGLMTALQAASPDREVILIEKNDKPGRKIYITGKGRCNLTNNSDADTFLHSVVMNPKFLYSAIRTYDQQDVMRDFETWGLSLKTERGNRVFPVSDHASDVTRTLEGECRKRGVRFSFGKKIKAICVESLEDESVRKATGVLLENGQKIPGDTVILATGGCSYPTTGSSGDGFRMLSDLGVEVIPPSPVLTELKSDDSVCGELAGLSLKNVQVTLWGARDSFPGIKKDRCIYREQGEMLFTHHGVSGPLCLSASSYLNAFLRKMRYKERDHLDGIFLSINLKPALNPEKLDHRIQRDFQKYQNRELRNALGDLLPGKMTGAVIRKAELDPDKQVNRITREERLRLVECLENFTIGICGFGDFSEAIVTSGGVSTRELNPSTMELKKIRNLKCVGEVIDCDALTGGFNLQIAWSTAKLAAVTLPNETQEI